MAASNAAACAEEVPEFSQSGACFFDADETRRPVTSQVDLSTEVKPPVQAWSDVCAFMGANFLCFAGLFPARAPLLRSTIHVGGGKSEECSPPE